MTRKGRVLVPATGPFWLKPASTFGLFAMTMFIARSPGFALPSILAPLRLDADRDIVPSRFRRQSADCGSIVRRRCTRRYLLAHLRRIPLMGQRVVSWHHATHNNDSDDFMSQPPVRTVLAAFIAHGSREKDVYRKCPFRQLHGVHRGQLARSLTTFVPFSLPSPSGPSPCMELSYMRTTLPHLTACRALESSLGSLPAYSPPSFTSLAGSPVFPMEDSNKTR